MLRKLLKKPIILSVIEPLTIVKPLSKPFMNFPSGEISQKRNFSVQSSDSNSDQETKSIMIHWKKRDGTVLSTKAKIGTVLLRSGQSNGVELEGACEGVCACSTCHVILDERLYNLLPEPSEIEEDMLDLAFGLTSTSRLSCQIKVDENFDGTTISIPKATRNFYVDGHVPKPH